MLKKIAIGINKKKKKKARLEITGEKKKQY